MTIAKNIKTTLPKIDDAKEFLANVVERFKTADKSLAGTLMAKLTTMKFDGMRGIQEHVLEMTNLAAQLKTLGMNVDEFFLVQFILNSLPPQYGPFQINYNTMKDKWNLNQLANMLNQEEARLKQLEQHSVHLVSQGAQRKWRKPKKGIKHGPHKANEPNPNVQAHKKEISNDKFHFYRKLGHYQKDCPKRRQWFEKKATTHVSNTMQGFLSIQTINPNENFMLIGNRGKQTKHTKKGATRSTKLLEIIHTDICGPFDTPSFVNALEVYITEVERQLERNVKIIRLDRGGEYYEKYCESGQYPGPFAKLLEKHDICAQYTMPGTPQQNGVAERRNRTLMDMDSLRIIMALVAHYDLELHQMDVKTTFLNRSLEEEVYMDQLEGFSIEGKEHLACKLKKSIYRLKQASRQWYLKFNDIITSFGFKENIVDRCIYLKVSGSKFIFLILYVDDILLASSDLGILHETKKFLSKNFEMKDMDEATYVIGIEIFRDRSRGILGLSQKAYIERVLERFKMENCSASVAPIQKGDKFNLMQCPQNELERKQMEGILMLLQYQSNPGMDHWKAAKKVMRYLQGTKDFMLTFRRSDSLEVTGYSDSDFAGCIDVESPFCICSGTKQFHDFMLTFRIDQFMNSLLEVILATQIQTLAGCIDSRKSLFMFIMEQIWKIEQTALLHPLWKTELEAFEATVQNCT
uniref:Integrase catalytic domain-containing protein n=1 Tax=Fagus sylvatica TaxID=28930 RepID=A0A2N9HCS5_FAGSY